jgi:electron transport complex protein RnfB
VSKDVYRRLADRLDEIPNGFPATESGAELKLLSKIFTPEEAALAAILRLELETADKIAARNGKEPRGVYRTLKTMVRKGQIRFGRSGGELAFGLMPFAVGIYEEQLPRLDQELAILFEQYFLEVQGALAQMAPPIHRVIPVKEAVPAGIEIYPYERASQLVETASAWGVRDCICRLQQKLIGKGCDRPLETCLVLAPVSGVFDHSETTRAVSKEEAFRILDEAAEAGLVHSPGNFQDEHFYICNCCTCCCGVLRNVAEFSVPTAIASSGFVAVVDEAACAGCGDCLARCQFGALALPSDGCEVDTVRCVGCGLCVSVCPSQALLLARPTAREISPPPASFAEWTAQRAEARGLGTDW